jgi:hypothetical protein
MKLQKQFLRRLLILLFAVAVVSVFSNAKNGASFAQATTDATRPHAFEPSEELVYVAEFSRALLKKVDVADFRFRASREPAMQRVNLQSQHSDPYLLKLTGDVSSKGFFAKLFNLRFREHIESTVEPAAFTVKRTTKIDEQGKRARTSETTYENGKVTWTERDPNNPGAAPREASALFTGQIQDLLSAIYFLRTQRLTVGKSFEVLVTDSGRLYNVPVQVVEKKRKKTVLGTVETVRVDPQVFGTQGMVSGEGQMSVWLTNDNRHIPVSARIKTKYGTFDITLRKFIQNSARQAVARETN